MRLHQSEHQIMLDSVINAMPQPCYLLDACDYTILAANSAAMNGYNGVEPVTCYMLVHNKSTPCHGTDHPCPLHIIHITKCPVKVEHVLHTPNGDSSVIEVHAYPLLDGDGHVVQVLEYAFEAPQATHREQHWRQLEKAVETMPLGLTITDLDGVIIYTNPAEAAMHGYTVDELCSQPVGIFAPPELRKPRTLEQIATWKGLIRESRNLRKDGTVFPVKLMSEIVKDSHGEPCAIVTSCEDITELKQTEDALREAEAKFRHIFENAVIGIFQTTQGGQVIQANRTLAAIYGYASPEAFLRAISDVSMLYCNPDDRLKFRQQLERHGTLMHFETQMYRKDGQIIWVDISARSVYDQHGHVALYEGTLIDITARKHAEDEIKRYQEHLEELVTKRTAELKAVNAQLSDQNVTLQQKNDQLAQQQAQLRESEARFRGLTAATFEGILIHEHGIVLDLNQALEAMFGYQRHDVLGKNALMFLTPPFREMAMQRIQQQDETPYEAEGIRRDGTTFPLEIQAKTMPYQGRSVRVAAIRDLSWRKAMEAEKVRLQEETLMFSMETLGFVTHELKSPLSAMQSMIALMLEGFAGELPGKIGAYLERIRQNCEELQDMVKNYLDFTRVGMGQFIANKTSVDYITAVLIPCVEQAQVLFESRGMTLHVESPDHVSVIVDAGLLRIALSNYLTNAAKYGAEKTQARVCVTEEHGRVITSVRNAGAGFTAQEQTALFAKFSRLKNKHTLKKRGSGLGLYLTKYLIELHNGTVWAESEPGSWAKFCFSFLATFDHGD